MPGILCINADFEMAWSGRRVPDDPARDALFEGTGETVEFGGLLGHAPVMPVNRFSCDRFIARKGRIPAPIHSFKN